MWKQWGIDLSRHSFFLRVRSRRVILLVFQWKLCNERWWSRRFAPYTGNIFRGVELSDVVLKWCRTIAYLDYEICDVEKYQGYNRPKWSGEFIAVFYIPSLGRRFHVLVGAGCVGVKMFPVWRSKCSSWLGFRRTVCSVWSDNLESV